MEVWLIVVITLSSLLCFIISLFCMWRCCSKRNRNETFEWIEKLGIPFAKEGEPDSKAFPPAKHYRVQHLQKISGEVEKGRDNHTIQLDEEESRMRSIPEVADSDPEDDIDTGTFKRLDHLGIPRARRFDECPSGKRPPSSPLPSPVPDYESSTTDDEENQPKTNT